MQYKTETNRSYYLMNNSHAKNGEELTKITFEHSVFTVYLG
jgi:hypothetical protein